MDYIYTPWREKYVRNVFKMNECIFCRALEMKNEQEALILFRGNYNFILLNKFPYTPGHLMIAPYKHLDSIEKATKKSTDELAELLKTTLKILRKSYNPQGFNAGMNIGQSAGAGIADHYHLHVIPRWNGDSNFMPLVGETKLFIEDLGTTYSRLKALFPGKNRGKK
jgi:ATP adenylyltransferase